MKFSGWFRRNNLIMLQAKNLAKQLNEAWAEQERLDKAFDWAAVRVAECREERDYLQDQLHRVARERFSERAHRLTIEQQYSNLQDEHLRLQQITAASVEDCHAERNLRLEALEKIAAWRIIDYEYCYICGNHKDCGHHPECYATQVDEAIRKHKGESDKSDLVAGLEHAVDLYDAIQERKAKENER